MSHNEPIPYGRQSISSSDVEAVAKQLVSDWLTTGPTVKGFEERLSAVTGGHEVIAVSSGTAALHCAFAALQLKPGDEVITSPITFVSTAATAIKEGAKVIFVDVDPSTANIDPEQVIRVINHKTRAIVAVDYAGNPADYMRLSAIAREHDIVLIADASHSLGASLNRRPVGDLADMTTLSFFPTKNIATGEGGAIVCKKSEFAPKVRQFRSHGLIREPELQKYPNEGPWHQEVHDFGLNYRLTDFQSALGISQLSRLSEFLERRAEIVKTYNRHLSGIPNVRTPGVTDGASPAWHLYPLRVPKTKRRQVFDGLRSQGIIAQVNYIPVYWHPVFEQLGYQRGVCPVAEDFYAGEISLPLYFDLQHEDVVRISQTINNFLSA